MHITLTDFARVRLFPKEPRPNTIRDITAEAFERYADRKFKGPLPHSQLRRPGFMVSPSPPSSDRAQ